MLTFYETPEGFILPKSMIDSPVIEIQLANDEEAKEIERFEQEQKRLREQRERESKERRAEIKRQIAEKKKKIKKKDDQQMTLFGDD